MGADRPASIRASVCYCSALLLFRRNETTLRHRPTASFCTLFSLSFLSPRVLPVDTYTSADTHTQVRGVSSIERLSVTQLNSEEPFVASVTLVAKAGPPSTENLVDESGGGQKTTPRQLLAAATAAVSEAVKSVLVRHNIGRNTVEIVVPADDATGGAVVSFEEETEGESGKGGGERPALLSAGESRSKDDEAERGQLGGGAGASGGNSHGHGHGHGHGQCSGHGHSHGHAKSADLV